MSDELNNPYGDSTQQNSYNESQNYNGEEKPKSKALAIWGMIIGIAMFLGGCCMLYVAMFSATVLILVPALIAIVGLILSIMSIANKQGGKGMAITGIILCSLAILGNAYMFLSLSIADQNIQDQYGMTIQDVMNGYLSGEITPEEYAEIMNNSAK